MTYEQFVYWLAGFLAGMDHEGGAKDLQKLLLEVIRDVKSSNQISGFTLGGCQL